MIELLLAILAAISIAIIAWVAVTVYVRFVQSGGQHLSEGDRMPLLFRFSMPYVKGFSRMFHRWLVRKGVISEQQEEF